MDERYAPKRALDQAEFGERPPAPRNITLRPVQLPPMCPIHPDAIGQEIFTLDEAEPVAA